MPHTITIGGVSIPLGDNRLLKARFEKYLSQPPESDAGNERRPYRAPLGPAARILLDLESRSEALLRPERLGAHLGAVPDAVASITLLLEISRHLVGDLNRRRVGKYLLARICSAATLARLVDTSGSQTVPLLRQITAWQTDTLSGRFPPDLGDRLSAGFDRLCRAVFLLQ